MNETARGSNPMMTSKIFNTVPASGRAMTVRGTVNKLTILFFMFLLTAGWGWNFVASISDSTDGKIFVVSLSIILLILGMATSAIPRISPATAPLYVLGEGVFIGAISRIYNEYSSGIVLQAVLLTLSIFVVFLAIYKFQIVKVHERFVKGVVAATGGVVLVYLVNLILSFFGTNIPFLHVNGKTGIIVNLIVVAIASMNFLADFYFIEKAERARMPKYMEWYLAFGVFVTFIWLYLEVLKLLSKIKKKD